ncbi:Uncharacterised protein [Shigella sonnei]|nr:Uncharacterised protein [Shigella sonnei]
MQRRYRKGGQGTRKRCWRALHVQKHAISVIHQIVCFPGTMLSRHQPGGDGVYSVVRHSWRSKSVGRGSPAKRLIFAGLAECESTMDCYKY